MILLYFRNVVTVLAVQQLVYAVPLEYDVKVPCFETTGATPGGLFPELEAHLSKQD